MLHHCCICIIILKEEHVESEFRLHFLVIVNEVKLMQINDFISSFAMVKLQCEKVKISVKNKLMTKFFLYVRESQLYCSGKVIATSLFNPVLTRPLLLVCLHGMKGGGTPSDPRSFCALSHTLLTCNSPYSVKVIHNIHYDAGIKLCTFTCMQRIKLSMCMLHINEQSTNHISLKVLCKATHCAGHVSANTKFH